MSATPPPSTATPGSAAATRGVAGHRRASGRELLLQVTRRWYVVLAAGLAGTALTLSFYRLYRPAYESEALIVLTRPLDQRLVQQLKATSVRVTQEPAVDPRILADVLRDRALSNRSLERLFTSKPGLFQEDLRATGLASWLGFSTRDRFVTYLRKHTTITALSHTIFRVRARGRSRRQAQALASWVVESALDAYVRRHRERAQLLATSARREAARARKELAAHEARLVAFLQRNPALMTGRQPEEELADASVARLRRRLTRRLHRLARGALAGGDRDLTLLLQRKAQLQSELSDLSGRAFDARGPLKELARARARLSRLRQQGLGDRHPSVRAAAATVARLRAEALRASPARHGGVSDYVARVRRQLREVNAKIKARLGKAGRQAVRPASLSTWRQLLREHLLLVQRTDSLERLAAMAIFNRRLAGFEARTLAFVREPPSLPRRPVGIQHWMVLIGGVAGSLLLGVGLALFIGYFDRRIYRPEEIGDLTGLALLATLPRDDPERLADVRRWARRANDGLLGWRRQEEEYIAGGWRLGRAARRSFFDDGAVVSIGARDLEEQTILDGGDDVDADWDPTGDGPLIRVRDRRVTPPLGPGLFITEAPHGAGADAVRRVAARLLDPPSELGRVVVAASWERRSGRTTLVANLGLALAEARRPTLLVDADPAGELTRQLGGAGGDPLAGLTAQLRARLARQGHVWRVHRLAEALYLLPGGDGGSEQGELLASPALAALLRDMRRVFAAVVVDTPALAAAPDAAVVAQQADHALLVVKGGRTRLPGVAAAIERLGAARVIGAVHRV